MIPYDVDALKANIDCRDLIARDLGPGKRSSKAVLYRCPLPQHQDDKPSFAVFADGWRCFGCGQYGDAIGWMTIYHHLTFQEACAYLSSSSSSLPAPKQPIEKAQLSPDEPPTNDWQNAAWEVVERAEASLWSTQGAAALRYLQDQRHLTQQTIRSANLGFIPGKTWKTIHDLNVAPGILIPWFAAGALWTLKIRRFNSSQKYTQVAGGSTCGLYGADLIRPYRPTLIVEGEFDALIGQQILGQWVNVVTTGAAGYALSRRWLDKINRTHPILVCLDNDLAGERGSEYLDRLLNKPAIMQVPIGKDLTDFYEAAGAAAVRRWIVQAIQQGH